jgi:hypothetical protein
MSAQEENGQQPGGPGNLRGSSMKIFPCPVCGRAFTRKFNLQRHMDPQRCSEFVFSQEASFYLPLIKHLTGALQAPVNDALLPYLWKCTCLYVHASPKSGFDAFWKLINILTTEQVRTAYQFDHRLIKPPIQMPKITAALVAHIKTLQAAGVQKIGRNTMTDLLQYGLPTYVVDGV